MIINDKLNNEVIYNTDNKICIKIGNKTILYFKDKKKYRIINNTVQEIDLKTQRYKEYKKNKAIQNMKMNYNKMLTEVEDIFKNYT